jgi:hypothetical protein
MKVVKPQSFNNRKQLLPAMYYSSNPERVIAAGLTIL